MSGERRGQGPGPGSVAARGRGPAPLGEPGAGNRRGGPQSSPARPETAGTAARLAACQWPLGRPLRRPSVYRPPLAGPRGPPPTWPCRDRDTLGPSSRPRSSGLRPPPRPPLPRQAGLALRGRPVLGTGSEPPRREAPAEAQARPLWVSVRAAAAAAVRVGVRRARPSCPAQRPSPACSPLPVGRAAGTGGAARPLSTRRGRAPQAARGPAGDSELRKRAGTGRSYCRGRRE